MSMPRWPTITKELFKVRITALEDLDTQPVRLGFMLEDAKPTDEDMHEATWQGDVGKSREAGVMVGPDTDIELTAGGYTVWYRVTDNPEIPWRPCGWVIVK